MRGIDRDDPVTALLHVAGYAIAWPVRFGRKADDGDDRVGRIGHRSGCGWHGFGYLLVDVREILVSLRIFL
jgi:hypothetical protein